MKRIEIIIPDRKLKCANEVIRDANTGGMSYYRIEGRGGVKAEPASFGSGATDYAPEFIPRIKVEVVVKDGQVEELVGPPTGYIRRRIGRKNLYFRCSYCQNILNTRKRGEAVI